MDRHHNHDPEWASVYGCPACAQEDAASITRQASPPETIPSGAFSAAAVAQCNPDLYADVTDLFDAVDPWSYLDDVLTSRDPEASAAAYEQIVTGEWDGEL